ncbi:acyltransferase [Amycolatopsis coloradensis]|uniref:Acyltransferase n=1 Tax=Amycolatopsis coloradensis TaxID=76021 RepID=A0ACD5BF09_9PSEU
MTQESIEVRGGARPALTSLRFFGALLVFITHAAYLAPFASVALAGGFIFIGINAGHFGVSLFFVLSGFVLTWSTGAGVRWRDFYRRRFMRIIPSHLVVFVPALVVTLLVAGIGLFPLLFNYLFLLQAWVWDFGFASQSPNPPTWTLGVEIFFYALFPLFYMLVRRIRHNRVWHWWVATGLLVLAITIVVGAILPSGPPSPAFPSGTWLQHKALLFFPVTRLPDFVIGMLTARLVQEGRFLKIGVGWAMAFTTVVYVATLFLPPIYGYSGMWAFPAALLIGAAATRDPRRPGLLESRPALWAGETTYAFYLVHLPLLLFALYVAGNGSLAGAKMGTVPGILFLLGMFVVSLLVARLLFVTVERPAMRRWGRSRRTGPGLRPVTVGGEDTVRSDDGEPERPGRAAA